LIPAYNEEAVIADALTALIGQTAAPEQIIVIDDCSTDRTAEIARSFGEDKMTVIRTPKNMGSKATALNYALQFVKSKYTLTIDADVKPAPDAFEKLALFARSDDTISAASGRNWPKQIKNFSEKSRFVEYLMAFPFYKSIQIEYGKMVVLPGCFTIYKTDELKQLGGWPTRTVTEDLDLTWTLYEHGKKVGYCKEAEVFISEPGNFKRLAKQLTRWNSGWFQVLKVHRKQVSKMPVLREFIAAAICDAILGAGSLAMMIIVSLGLSSPINLLYYLSLDVTVTIVMPAREAGKIGRLGQFFRCIPSWWAMRYVSTYFYFHSLVQVVLLRRGVEVFEKGH
jgi:cellulose synthase/poly-beta-1,6-N-acetylglucosamine synthase-like glycosyltransferase